MTYFKYTDGFVSSQGSFSGRALYNTPMLPDNYSVPIINVSSFQDKDVNALRYGVDHCFLNGGRESFHEYLRNFTNRSKNTLGF